MAGLVPAIHVLLVSYEKRRKTWMPGTRPGMTMDRYVPVALCGLAACQEITHSAERLQNILGRVGVGQPHIAFAENPEIGTADDGDAGIVKERIGKRLRHPPSALDIRKCIERALRDRAAYTRQPVEPLD